MKTLLQIYVGDSVIKNMEGEGGKGLGREEKGMIKQSNSQAPT